MKAFIERCKPYERGIESAIRVRHIVRSPEGRSRMFYLSKSHFDSRRARRLFETLIIVPAVYLALQQQPVARSIALLSLGRKRSCLLAKAMEGDRGIRRERAARGADCATRFLTPQGDQWNPKERELDSRLIGQFAQVCGTRRPT